MPWLGIDQAAAIGHSRPGSGDSEIPRETLQEPERILRQLLGEEQLDVIENDNRGSFGANGLVLRQTKLFLASDDPQQRDVAFWILDIARSNYEETAPEAEYAIESLSLAGYDDDATLQEWKWQAFLERRFGHNSPEALEGLAHIANRFVSETLFARIEPAAATMTGPVADRLKSFLRRRTHRYDFVQDPPGTPDLNSLSTEKKACYEFCLIPYRHCIAIGLDRTKACEPQYKVCAENCRVSKSSSDSNPASGTDLLTPIPESAQPLKVKTVQGSKFAQNSPQSSASEDPSGNSTTSTDIATSANKVKELLATLSHERRERNFQAAIDLGKL